MDKWSAVFLNFPPIFLFDIGFCLSVLTWVLETLEDLDRPGKIQITFSVDFDEWGCLKAPARVRLKSIFSLSIFPDIAISRELGKFIFYTLCYQYVIMAIYKEN